MWQAPLPPAGFHWVNMVRAGVVKHLEDWQHNGYHEIINPPRRYRVLAGNALEKAG